MNDKILMIAAVAVTAVVCIGGMYFIFGGTDQRQDLNILVKEGVSMPSFEEFENNTKANVHATFSNTLSLTSLDGDVRAIVSDAELTFDPAVIAKRSDGSIFVYYKIDDTMANFFANWLCE